MEKTVGIGLFALLVVGVAFVQLTRVVHDAKEYGCGTVQITASDMGVKLYSNFGFVPNKNFMQYKLS